MIYFFLALGAVAVANCFRPAALSSSALLEVEGGYTISQLQNGGRVFGRRDSPDALEKLSKDFSKVQSLVKHPIEKTFILQSADGSHDKFVLYDLTLDNPHCPKFSEFPEIVSQLKPLSGGRSGSLVVSAQNGSYVIKNVKVDEFNMMVSLINDRELKSEEPALYESSLLSPVCWGLDEWKPKVDMLWIIMPNMVVPKADEVEEACKTQGSSSFIHTFDIKGKKNNGPVRSATWQSWFGKNMKWEYGLEKLFPGGFKFYLQSDRDRFFKALSTDLQSLTDEDICDYSAFVAVYGCEGSSYLPAFRNASANKYDFPMRLDNGTFVRVSFGLLDFAIIYSQLNFFERWFGAKGWSAENYGDLLKEYLESTFTSPGTNDGSHEDVPSKPVQDEGSAESTGNEPDKKPQEAAAQSNVSATTATTATTMTTTDTTKTLPDTVGSKPQSESTTSNVATVNTSPAGEETDALRPLVPVDITPDTTPKDLSAGVAATTGSEELDALRPLAPVDMTLETEVAEEPCNKKVSDTLTGTTVAPADTTVVTPTTLSSVPVEGSTSSEGSSSNVESTQFDKAGTGVSTVKLTPANVPDAFKFGLTLPKSVSVVHKPGETVADQNNSFVTESHAIIPPMSHAALGTPLDAPNLY